MSFLRAVCDRSVQVAAVDRVCVCECVWTAAVIDFWLSHSFFQTKQRRQEHFFPSRERGTEGSWVAAAAATAVRPIKSTCASLAPSLPPFLALPRPLVVVLARGVAPRFSHLVGGSANTVGLNVNHAKVARLASEQVSFPKLHNADSDYQVHTIHLGREICQRSLSAFCLLN